MEQTWQTGARSGDETPTHQTIPVADYAPSDRDARDYHEGLQSCNFLSFNGGHGLEMLEWPLAMRCAECACVARVALYFIYLK